MINGYKAARNRPVTRSQKQVNQLIAAVRARMPATISSGRALVSRTDVDC
ncbi:hypothetical protein [Streptomyces sp. NPDC059909]